MTCSSCGQAFAEQDLATFGEHSVCAACQPAFVQSYRQGMVAAAPREIHYAGFWIRVCAQAVDILILYLFQLVVALMVGVAMSGPAITQAVLTDLQIVEFLVDIFYFCFFWTHEPGAAYR